MILTGEAVKTTDRAQELLTHAASVVLEGLGEKDETVAEEIGARALRCLLKHFALVYLLSDDGERTPYQIRKRTA